MSSAVLHKEIEMSQELILSVNQLGRIEALISKALEDGTIPDSDYGAFDNISGVLGLMIEEAGQEGAVSISLDIHEDDEELRTGHIFEDIPGAADTLLKAGVL